MKIGDNGWIKLHRRIDKNWLWNSKPFSKGQAWIDLILMANHAQGKVVFREEIIEVDRGQKVTSEVKLAEKWGWSRGKIRRFINDLEREQMLSIERNNRRTIYTVCNYNDYQDNEPTDSTTNGTTKSQQTVQQTDINKKKEEELKNVKKKTLCPFSEIKDEWNQICTGLSKVMTVTEKRKPHIRARWEQHKTMESFTEAFEKIQASNFCKGQNDRGWKANFDWVMENDTNMVKVLEGKYDNKKGVSKKPNGFANYKERDLQYTEEELEEILKKRRQA